MQRLLRSPVMQAVLAAVAGIGALYGLFATPVMKDHATPFEWALLALVDGFIVAAIIRGGWRSSLVLLPLLVLATVILITLSLGLGCTHYDRCV